MKVQVRAHGPWTGMWIAVAFMVGLLTTTVVGEAGGSLAAPPEDVFVSSPLEGYFLAGEKAGDTPLIAVGDTVKVNTVIGYVQSMYSADQGMKYAVEAGVEGTVMEILVKDLDPVERDQPLVRIMPHQPKK